MSHDTNNIVENAKESLFKTGDKKVGCKYVDYIKLCISYLISRTFFHGMACL